MINIVHFLITDGLFNQHFTSPNADEKPANADGIEGSWLLLVTRSKSRKKE